MRALRDFTEDRTLNVEQNGFLDHIGFLVLGYDDDAFIARGAPYLIANLEKGAITLRTVFKEHRSTRP
jgi:hypothetical protein